MESIVDITSLWSSWLYCGLEITFSFNTIFPETWLAHTLALILVNDITKDFGLV